MGAFRLTPKPALMNLSLFFGSLPVAALGTGCSVLQAPQAPVLQGLRSLQMPEVAQGAAIAIDVEVRVENPNDHVLALTANDLELSIASTGERIGRAELKKGAQLPPKGAHSDIPILDVRLLVDRTSWRRDLLVLLNSGQLRVRGPLKADYRGNQYDVILDEIVGGKDALVSPIRFSAPKRIGLNLKSFDEMAFAALIDVNNGLGQAFQLEHLKARLGAENTVNPMEVAFGGGFVVGPSGTTNLILEGLLDLSSCDATVLDDIESNGRRLTMELVGVIRGRTFPELDLAAVRFELELPQARGQTTSRGTAVEVAASLTAVASLISATPADLLPGLASGLGSVLTGQGAAATMTVRNPLPGTVVHQEGRIQILDRPGGRKWVDATLAEPTSMPPRGQTQVPLRIQLLGDRRGGLGGLLGGGMRLPEQGVLHHQWSVRIPVFGTLQHMWTGRPIALAP